MKKLKIFVVEDDKWYAEILMYRLRLNEEYEVEHYSSGRDLLDNLYKRPSVITLDYGLGDMNGAEVLQKVKQAYPDLPVIIISSQEEIGVALDLLHKGAYDYIIKNEETQDRLWKILINIRDHEELKQKHEELKKEVKQKYTAKSTILGESPAVLKVFGMMDKVKDSNITVSITGETGTGKEMVAKAIHYNSSRADQPFIAVNMSAIPEGLVESELFGHEKGAFTGAASKRIGKFELANNGTLFLDEIAEMSLSAQTKILRVLQEQELTRVGGDKSIKINTRLIVATHKNLLDETVKGRFREDLYYRIMGVPIQLPPLRERGNDVVILANYFLQSFCKENKKEVARFSPEAMKKLLQYKFPGNIRELKAIVELGAILTEADEIKESNLIFNRSDEIALFESKELTLEQYNYKVIEHFMKKYNNKAIPVAKILNISKSTIYRLLRKMNYDF